jgi:hypothetical protein
MGVWGIGLYSGDFAQDLRASVKAVSRLPVAPERLLEYLVDSEPSVANDPTDPDHTVFWLVVADQFAKRSIDSPGARERALNIIRDGTDLAAMKALGMDDKSLAKRRAMLEEVRARIDAPPRSDTPRAVLKAPQKLLLEVGDVVAYPICKQAPLNPYAGKDSPLLKDWHQEGWGAFVLAERGLQYDYLAWYRPLVICEPLQQGPTLPELMEARMWLLRNPGTLTSIHASKMQFKSLGRVSIDPAKLSQLFPQRMSPVSCVVSDITIANSIDVRGISVHEAHRVKHGYPPTPRIHALMDVADAIG